MTSDAKIGLLLGLVFIFVIAFIINGLPNLKPQQTTRADVLKTENVVAFPDERIGIADTVQAQTERNWDELIKQQETMAEDTPGVGEQPAPVVVAPTLPAQTQDNPDIRFERALPRLEDLWGRIADGLKNQAGQTSTVTMDVPAAAETTPAPQPAQTRPAEAVARAVDPRQAPVPKLTGPAGKTYVVQEGESLSTVAKKVYGPEEGNRIVNVRRIYEANKDVLKSEHEVVAGQKLVIPPLPKPADVLRGELFEKVEALGRRTAAQASVASTEARLYTVQDGDNLWKIASSQLGAGARYEEIAKLNADLLKDREKLDVGMKIRLPLK